MQPCSARGMPDRNTSELASGISCVTGRSLRESRSYHDGWPGRELGEIAPISDNNCCAMGQGSPTSWISLSTRKSKTAPGRPQRRESLQTSTQTLSHAQGEKPLVPCTLLSAWVCASESVSRSWRAAIQFSHLNGLLRGFEGKESILPCGVDGGHNHVCGSFAFGNSRCRRLTEAHTEYSYHQRAQPNHESKVHMLKPRAILIDLHGDGLFLGLFGLRHPDFQHTVLEGRLDFLALHLTGQGNGP